MKKLFTLESLLVRFGTRMLRLSNSECALSVDRMAIEEAGHSDTGELFYEAGPADWIALLEGLLSKAMLRGELAPSNPHVAACQLMALVMSETRARLHQPAPPPLTLEQMRSMARRAVETFLVGAATVSSS